MAREARCHTCGQWAEVVPQTVHVPLTINAGTRCEDWTWRAVQEGHPDEAWRRSCGCEFNLDTAFPKEGTPTRYIDSISGQVLEDEQDDE